MWDLNWQLKYHLAIQIFNHLFQTCRNITTSILDKLLKQKEFKDAFFALKANKKSLGYDKLHVNVTA